MSTNSCWRVAAAMDRAAALLASALRHIPPPQLQAPLNGRGMSDPFIPISGDNKMLAAVRVLPV
jgi:uncharacterized protein (UPF0210 family)